jgi:hypothetical protein
MEMVEMMEYCGAMEMEMEMVWKEEMVGMA